MGQCMGRRRREADAVDLHTLKVMALGTGHAEVLMRDDRWRAVEGSALGAGKRRGLDRAVGARDRDVICRRRAGGKKKH